MPKHVLTLFLLFSAVLFAQEATPASTLSKPANQAQDAATTPSATTDSTDSVTLVFYRPKRFTGSGLTPSVFVNSEQIARLDNGRFFVLSVKPGTYKIESSMKHDPLETEVKAGKTQFFEMVILTGNWRGGGRLIPTGEGDAREAIKKLKPLDAKWATSSKVTFVLSDDNSSSTGK